MNKIFRINIILIAIALSFYSLSFGGQAAKEISHTNSSNELIYGHWILHQKGEAPFLWLDGGFGCNFYEAKPSKAFRNREFSMDPEITNTIQSPSTDENQKIELPSPENSQLSKGKSGYHFGKIQLTKSNLDPYLDIIYSLLVAQYKEENPRSWALEKFKENDILKSIAILLELKLNF